MTVVFLLHRETNKLLTKLFEFEKNYNAHIEDAPLIRKHYILLNSIILLYFQIV